MFWFWFWIFVGPALALTALSLRGERRRAAYVRRRLAETPENLPPASVIVPVKGMDEGLRQNLAALAALDYPDYELLIVAHSASDIPAGVLPRHARVILAHGRDPHTGEKVQNLVTAVHAARHRSQVFAFADSDGRVTKRWLRALVAPLLEEGVGASSGYRWFTPDRATLWTLLRGVWDAVPAGILGPGDNRFAWGGAMAIRREVFFDTAVLRYWKRTISDDYALSAAVHCGGPAHSLRARRAGALPGANFRRRAIFVDAPPDDDHAHVQPRTVAAGPGSAPVLLRGDDCVGDGPLASGIGWDGSPWRPN